jgi:HPt (histidine-containing phosphotransfer) domain-containing protein
VIIDVNAAVAELVPGYLERREAEIQVLGNALAAGDLPVIQRIAHNMKGTGGGYGFPEITEIGRAMEAAAKIGNRPEICARLSELTDLLVKLKNSRVPVARL